jgi:hypothetical protein
MENFSEYCLKRRFCWIKEVVVIGYGVRKKDATGAVDQIELKIW